MHDIKNYIETEIKHSKLIIKEIDRKLKEKKQGTLVLQCRNGKLRYYNQVYDKTTKKSHQRYLGDETSKEVILRKKQKFFGLMRERVASNLNLLETVANKLHNYSPEDIYESLPFSYRDIDIKKNVSFACDKKSQNFKLSEEDFIGRSSKKLNITVDGTTVRSKGEVIIYNLLWLYGVEFKYESRVEVTEFNGLKSRKAPDFIIELLDGRVLFWEHFGMLDVREYVNDFTNKVQLYHENGIVMGDNLIVTADRKGGSINSKAINDIIVNMILPICKRKNQVTV